MANDAKSRSTPSAAARSPLAPKRDLAAWLAYLETLHPKTIELGLDRVSQVFDRLALRIDGPVVTVGGTNGKGSSCALLEAMLRAGAYRVGLYSSPHLLRYNERVRLDGSDASDDALCQALAAVEAARAEVPLTYFEFGTLAALWLFAQHRLDVLILEVGLGGRLDAVNIVAPDVAVVTTVDIDHVDFLGSTRESIGREKAGIFRAGRVAICADRDPPASLLAYAREIGTTLLRIGVDFDATDEGGQWRYRGPSGERFGLPHPALRGPFQLANAAAALTALDALRDALPLSMGAIREGLLTVQLPGRFQVLPGRPAIVLDVAHNAQAARILAHTLGGMGFHPETWAVFAIMADKDIDAVIAAMKDRVDRWLTASLPPPRGATSAQLDERLRDAGVAASSIRAFAGPGEAYRFAREAVGEADRIVVFGSFLTVAAALASPHGPTA